MPLDITDREAITRAFTDSLEPPPALDILVNAAGMALGLEPVHRTSIEDWDRMIETNCRALVYVTRLALPAWWLAAASHRQHRLGGRQLPYRAATSTAPPRPSCASSRWPSAPTCSARRCGSQRRAGHVRHGVLHGPLRRRRRQGRQRLRRDDAALAADVADVVAWSVTRPGHVNVTPSS